MLEMKILRKLEPNRKAKGLVTVEISKSNAMFMGLIRTGYSTGEKFAMPLSVMKATR